VLGLDVAIMSENNSQTGEWGEEVVDEAYWIPWGLRIEKCGVEANTVLVKLIIINIPPAATHPATVR